MENQNNLTFQQAMSRLDSIVEQLNNSSLELETAMSLFKEGLALSKQCESQLKQFETQMNELLVDTANS
ncbi:MAG: exodeoxyribonuclease VII small subunit [Ileibacterium sp.]|nr:exodeoxyribonuclease VII small subunit [Ileibacterium sp.]